MYALIFYSRANKNLNEERRTAETNRNLSLAAAQIAWMALVGQADAVPTSVCQAFGAVTHYAWLLTFTWTGKIF